MKGVGGIYGNRGGTKKFPVCRNCDEIMDKAKGFVSLEDQTNHRNKIRKFGLLYVIFLVLIIGSYVTAQPFVALLLLIPVIIIIFLVFKLNRTGRVS